MTMISEIIAILLQGISVTVLGWFVYNAGKHGFWVSGDPQTKEFAQAAVVGFLLVTGFASSAILRFFQEMTVGFTDIQLIGIGIIISRVVVNEMVDRWRQDDRKSLYIHGIGFLLIILPTF
ncbi:hypothetical protein [Halostella sp. PRR32]|uniref:hypothetical protein n=1 Tax=Halostella sp. PRR32 TaxID=3098147 RepID=UPI002B1DC2CE|nr:hypothetical protein [Halostella sp. PRR32]